MTTQDYYLSMGGTAHIGLGPPTSRKYLTGMCTSRSDVDSPSIEVPFPQMSLVSIETAEMDTAHTRNRVAQFFL